jgi:sulfate permease, SulP family
MCTVMAGIILVIMGLTGMGSAVKYIPRPIVIGFTNGIAILIASTQIKDFFGLKLEKVPGVFWLRMEALAQNFHTISFEATALAAGTIVIISCRAVSNRIPGAIVALVLGTLGLDFQTSGRHHRLAFQRNSQRNAASFTFPCFAPI